MQAAKRVGPNATPSLRLDPLMKKRLRYFPHHTPKDTKWFTNLHHSRQLRGVLMEKLLMETVLLHDTIRDPRFWSLRRLYGTTKYVIYLFIYVCMYV